MNKLFLIGYLGSDPSVREAANKEKYCHFSLATDEYWTDGAGARQKRTEWHSVFFWAAKGETIATQLKKGSRVYVEGRLESRLDPEAGASRRIWSVKGLHYELLDRRADTAGHGAGSSDIGGGDSAADDVPL